MDTKPLCCVQVHSGPQSCSILTQDQIGPLRLGSFLSPGFHLLERTSPEAVWKNEVTPADPSESTALPKTWEGSKGDHGKVEKFVGEPEVTPRGSEQDLSSELSQESKLPLQSMESHEQENSLQGQEIQP